jgi:hypothetical protein
MQGENKERWQELCAQAAIEQDPVKMIKLVKEINDLLADKEERLIKSRLTPNLETTV